MGSSAKQPSKQYHHKKGIFPPSPSILKIPSLFRLPRSSAHSPLSSILSVSNRHCLHRSNTLSPYIHYMRAHIELPLSLQPPPTGPCFVSLGGLAAIEPSVPFASRVIYKQYMDAVHTPTFHPPTLSHFSSTDTQSPL